MKKLIDFLNSKKIMFKQIEQIQNSNLKTKKNISVFLATSIDKKYWLILIYHNKTKILRKECEFFETIYEKCKEIKQHNFAIKALFCNTDFCSKSINELKENRWKIYNDFV